MSMYHLVVLENDNIKLLLGINVQCTETEKKYR